jgi:glycosyltransferase involved in cell wall biosynthesis
MKIGLVIPALVRQGGGERQFLYLARGLIKKGHRVVIYTINYDKRRCYPSLIQGLDIRAVYYRSPKDVTFAPFLKAYLFYPELYLNLKRIAALIDRDTDIINAHGEGMGWLVLRLKPEWCGKFVWMCNDSPTWIEVFKKKGKDKFLNRVKNILDRALIYRFISYLERKAARKIDRIVALSGAMKKSLEFCYNRRVSLLRSGCDLEKFDASRPFRSAGASHRRGKGRDGALIRKRYGIAEKDFFLLHVSLLQPLRRIEDAIRALGALKDNYPGLKMLIAGSLNYHPSYVEDLKNLIKSKKLDSNIIMAGEVSDGELHLHYGACDAFIFPSDGRQTWGLAVFEAMAAKKPVIVSSACGAAEVLKDERDAFFISPGDISGIAGVIGRIIEDRDLRERIAREGYKFVKENLSWAKYVRGMEDIFEGKEDSKRP